MKRTMSRTTLRRLDIQGFDTVPVADLAAVAPYLRITYALCGAIAATGTVLEAPLVLWGLAPVAFLGAVLPVHPFDLVYNLGLRRLTGTGPLPRRGAPVRFACAVATAWLLATGWAFATGRPTLGSALGQLLVASATLVSITDICLPSMLFRLVGRRPPCPRSLPVTATAAAQAAAPASARAAIAAGPPRYGRDGRPARTGAPARYRRDGSPVRDGTRAA
jgi:hypothetical protein